MTKHKLAARSCAALIAICALAAFQSPAEVRAEKVTKEYRGAIPSNGEVALTWAPVYMSDNQSYTMAEAVALAERVDLIGAMPISFGKYGSEMRRANPDLTLLSYANGTLTGDQHVRDLPEAAFAHDPNGKRIHSNVWGTVLMAPSSPAWHRAATTQCTDRVAQGKYDGCIFDTVGLGIFSAGANFTGMPVNPATKKLYTEAAYRADLVTMMRELGERAPGLIRVGNSVETDFRYWRDSVQSRPLALSQSAVLMEDFLRGAGTATTTYPSVEKWLRNVEVVRDLESNGVSALYVTKVWKAASNAQLRQWQGYSMASFLLGANGDSYLAFSAGRNKAGANWTGAPYAMPNGLGEPLSGMVRLGSGAYTRTFARGMSVVNPTASAITVQLPSSMKSLNGTTVTRLTLPAHSGDVLVKP